MKKFQWLEEKNKFHQSVPDDIPMSEIIKTLNEESTVLATVFFISKFQKVLKLSKSFLTNVIFS